MTQLLNVHPTHPQARLLKMAADALHKGELWLIPATPRMHWRVMSVIKRLWKNSYKFANYQKTTNSP